MGNQPKLLSGMTMLSVVMFCSALGVVFFYAPLEAVMNFVQKVFYFHLAYAWVGMLGFITAAYAGARYLISKDLRWDLVEISSIEISLVFFFIAIISGSIWARPTWGTWWTWDARLTTAAILEMVYLACLIFRRGIDDPEKRARFSAVYTLVGGLSIPMTFFSIRLWQTIHPVIIGGQNQPGQSMFGMTPEMTDTLLFCVATFTIVFITLLWYRIRLENLSSALEDMKASLTEDL